MRVVDTLSRKWQVTDTIQKADVIVGVGCGIAKDGSTGALSKAIAQKSAELFHQGVADKVLFLGGFTQNGITEAQAMKLVAVKLGVPEDVITLEKLSTSTYRNALEARKVIDGSKIESMLIVAQHIHMRRVLATFKRVFGSGMTLYWASAYSEYEDLPSKWQLSAEWKFLLWECFWSFIYKFYRYDY